MSQFDRGEGTPPDNAMAYISDMMGRAFHDKIVAALGGTDINVPKTTNRLNPAHPLVVALGADDAAEVVDLVGGERITVPRGAQDARGRREAVAAALKEGLNNNQIARNLGITCRHVRRLRPKVNEPMMAAE